MAQEKLPRVLVAEDSPTQTKQIRYLLEDSGYEVRTAGHGKEALEMLGREVPDLVVTDLEMPEMNGLELVEAIRRDHPEVPVVLITAHGSEDVAALALRKGAASYVPKVFLVEDLVPTLENILAVTQARRFESEALRCLTSSESHFVLDNDSARVTPLLGYLESLLARLGFGDATGRMRVGVAVHEALLNAIQHGNLEVSSDLRQENEDHYRDELKRRRRQSPYAERRVHLKVKLTPAEVVYTVRDEGPGFDPTRLPDPFDPSNLERIGGRGLVLIRNFMDRVSHNPTGNEITMVKYREP